MGQFSRKNCKYLIGVLALLVSAGCSNIPSYMAPANSSQLATIHNTGTGILTCGLTSNPVCKARVSLIDGRKTDLLTSDSDLEPGEHTIRLFCLVKTGAFASPKGYFEDLTVTLTPGGKYHVDGAMEGESCKLTLVDDNTNGVVKPTVTVVKASPLGTYPDSGTITLFSSTDTVSTWNETAAETYLIPNSQMFVSGHGGNGGTMGGVFGGLVGALVGIHADRSKNSAAVARIEDGLRLTFNQQLSDAVKAAINAHPSPGRYAEVNTKKDARLLLLPSATLVLSKDDMTTLTFRLTVRNHDQQNGNGASTNFFYTIGEKRPLDGPGGWTENQSKAIRDSASIALAKLSSALLDDIEGLPTIEDPQAGKTDIVFRAH
jgi:hypothetical protein